jgi:hypothetical protein
MLPEDLEAGIYQLRAFTNRIRQNAPELAFTCDIVIVNLAKGIPASISLPLAVPEAEAATNIVAGNAPVIKFVPARSDYNYNETVHLEVTIENLHPQDTANISVSVSRKTPFEELLMNRDIAGQFKIYRNTGDNAGLNGLERYGYILTGTVRDKKTGIPVSNGNIVLAVVDSVYLKLMCSSSDEKGAFRFYLNDYFDNREIILQLIGSPDEQKVTWELDGKELKPGQKPVGSVDLSEEQLGFLDETKDIRLIEAIYAEPPSVKKYQAGSAIFPNYFNQPDMVVYPSDFTDLVNFREIADNILPTVKFYNRGNIYFIQVFNTKTEDWHFNSMVFLNGIPFTDLNYIATLGSRDIERIEVFPTGYLVGAVTFNGIVSIYTRDHVIPETYLKNRTFAFQNQVVSTGEPSEGYSARSMDGSESHLPDFRNNLYWNPEILVTGNNNRLVIEFPASELNGKYNICIQGVTSNGDPLSALEFIEIK